VNGYGFCCSVTTAASFPAPFTFPEIVVAWPNVMSVGFAVIVRFALLGGAEVACEASAANTEMTIEDKKTVRFMVIPPDP
jgi:hypothetical protein